MLLEELVRYHVEELRAEAAVARLAAAGRRRRSGRTRVKDGVSRLLASGRDAGRGPDAGVAGSLSAAGGPSES